MAYGKKSKREKISKKQLYFKYSHFGKRNFITYAQNAAKKEYTNSEGLVRPGLDSQSIKKQLSSHFAILENELRKTSHEFATSKNTKVKKISLIFKCGISFFFASARFWSTTTEDSNFMTSVEVLLSKNLSKVNTKSRKWSMVIKSDRTSLRKR